MKNHDVKIEFHFLTVLALGLSASLWAICDTRFFMPVVWLMVLCAFVLVRDPGEFSLFFRRFTKIGVTLSGISLLQIVFRRSGETILSAGHFPLVFSDGLREAVLLWVRFMILFALAHVMAHISMFHFLLFTNKIRLPLNLGLLLLMALKLIPFIFSEAKRALWFLRFRSIRIRELTLRNRMQAGKQLIYAILMRSMDYVFHSALAMELRGYGSGYGRKIPRAYPVKRIDVGFIGVIICINLFGFWID
jgi:energy-coupling factor transporter transmembrane protein EcfT